MAIEAQGTKFYWSTSTAVSTSTSALVGSVTDFSGPGGEAADIDITSFDSTAKEYLIGLRDEGQFTMTVNLATADAGQAALQTDRANRTKKKAILDFSTISISASSTNARRTFDAYCKGFSISGAVDDKVTASITLRITGAVASTKQTT